MIWIDFNPRAGRDARRHPLLVLRPGIQRTHGIVIGLPMTTASYNETNPFAVKLVGPRKIVSYIPAPAEVVRLAGTKGQASSVEAGARGGVRARRHLIRSLARQLSTLPE
jgi:hypothetical protein